MRTSRQPGPTTATAEQAERSYPRVAADHSFFWRFLGPKKNGSFWGVWGQKLCGDPKSLFWKEHLELSVREETRSDGHEELWDMSCFWCQKGHFTEGSKTCFAYMSFKLTLYKNRYVYKLCASGGTVTQYWAFVDIAKHFPRDFEYFYRGDGGIGGRYLLCAVFSCIYAYVSLLGCIFLLL